MKFNESNLFNELVYIMNNHKVEKIKAHAKLLLGQYNTAGGKRMEHEVESFVNKNAIKIKKTKMID